MENIEAGVLQRDEGDVPEPTASNTLAEPRDRVVTTPEQEVVGDKAQEIPRPETAPDLSPSGIRKLRGQYFTIRHIPLTDCGHKLDVINEPRHRNCQNCFWQWMNFHPQLVSTVDEAWREHGKAFVIRLRGKHFAEQFGRYMATVAHFKEQEKANGLEAKKE